MPHKWKRSSKQLDHVGFQTKGNETTEANRPVRCSDGTGFRRLRPAQTLITSCRRPFLAYEIRRTVYEVLVSYNCASNNNIITKAHRKLLMKEYSTEII